MVNADGQLFTIEGIAAALIMLVTVYIVVNTTSVYTPGDTHINDMQLEVIGTDALKMMNTPPSNTFGGRSPLEIAVENRDGNAFYQFFNSSLNNRTWSRSDTIHFMANVTYYKRADRIVNSTLLNRSRPLYGGEHAVHISQWVMVKGNDLDPDWSMDEKDRRHAALVEVLLWRD
jgi:primase-polymerase (primpol)-like protein